MAGIALLSLLPVIMGSPASGGGNNGTLTLRQPTVSASAYAGTTYGGRVVMPYVTISASASSGQDRTLPLMTISAVALPGSVTRDLFQFDIRLQPPTISASTVGFVGGVANLTPVDISAFGVTGAVGGVDNTLQRVTISSFAHGPLVGGSSVSLPRWVMAGATATPYGAAFSTVSMHTEQQALTTYSNYPFNSYTKFNGVYLGASTLGVFALSGATDAGTAILGAAEGGDMDMGTSFMKSVDRAYIGGTASGALRLSLTTDGAQTRGYAVTHTGQAGPHENRVVLGRGVVSRYYRMRIENVAGAQFSLYALELRPTLLKRRIGGGGV